MCLLNHGPVNMIILAFTASNMTHNTPKEDKKGAHKPVLYVCIRETTSNMYFHASINGVHKNYVWPRDMKVVFKAKLTENVLCHLREVGLAGGGRMGAASEPSNQS